MSQRPRGRGVLDAEWVEGHEDVSGLEEEPVREDHVMSNLVDELAGKAAAEVGPPDVVVRGYLETLENARALGQRSH